MLALRQGEVLWNVGGILDVAHSLGFSCDARGLLDGLLVRMCNAGDRVPRIDYLRGSLGISGARRGGKMAQHDAADSWGRMGDPGAVAFGGQRDGVAVVVEVDATQLNKAKRTQVRVAGRPRKRWIRGAVGGRNDSRYAVRVLGVAAIRLTESIGICGKRYTSCAPRLA